MIVEVKRSEFVFSIDFSSVPSLRWVHAMDVMKQRIPNLTFGDVYGHRVEGHLIVTGVESEREVRGLLDDTTSKIVSIIMEVSSPLYGIKFN